MGLFAFFLEGLLSFLSPCVLPLLPLFMSYLSGEGEKDDEGVVHYKQGRVFLTTLFFALGMSMIFVILAFSASYIGSLISDYLEIVAIIGGVVIIIFALQEIGIINIDVLNYEWSFLDKLNLGKISYFKAFVFGFFFTCAWSPCIGPMLGSALTAAVSQQNGYLYLLIYGVGFIIPFLICGLFTSYVLNFIREKKKLLTGVMKVAGIILLCYGVYLISSSAKEIVSLKREVAEDGLGIMEKSYNNQDGDKVSFKEHKGQYLFLNFTATWCTYCLEEVPAYETFAQNHPECVCYFIMSPQKNGSDLEAIKEYYINNNLTLDIVVDEKNYLFSGIGISSYPTLIVVGPDGEVLGYTTGAMSEEAFEAVYNNAIEIFESK